MKNKIFLFTILVLSLFLTACSNKSFQQDKMMDSVKFKEEYESYNDKINPSNNKRYRRVEIVDNNPFIYKEAEDIVEMMENKETFVVYFGFATCPWCRSVLSTLINVADDLNIGKVYYVDVKNIRDQLSVNEYGEVVVDAEGTEDYYKLLELFDVVLKDYQLTDEFGIKVDSGEKRIYAPNVISVVKGEVVSMTDGISEQQTNAYSVLTDEMLKESYKKFECSLKCIVNEANKCSVDRSC